LGIKSLNFSPNGHYLSVGFYDQVIRIYNHITWKLIIEFSHPQTISENNSNVNIFKEEESDDYIYGSEHNKKTTKYIDVQVPVKLPNVKPNIDKPNPAIGIGECNWSYDSNYFATRNDNMPNVLWIWQISSLSLHTVIIQQKPIKNFQWSPTEHILLIVTENSKLYTFTLTNVYVVELVTDVNYNLGVGKITWNSDGKSFVVSDKNYMVIGYPELNEQPEEGIQEEENQDVINENDEDRYESERHDDPENANYMNRSNQSNKK
jgi:WD40 repeat protein